MGRNFSPARNVLSITLPSLARLSLVRTNAPPLPGLTCWNSTILKTVPSTSMWVPFLNWLVLITAARLAASRGAPPGRGGQHALRQGARRSRLDVRAQIAPVAHQRDARGDHVVGGVQALAAQDTGLDPRVDAVELRRQLVEQATLRPRVDVEDESAQESRPRAARPGAAPQQWAERAAIAAVDHRLEAVQASAEGDPAGGHLEHLVAPALGLLDLAATGVVGREERRVRLHLVERTGEHDVRLDLPPIHDERRHGALREPGERERALTAGRDGDRAVRNALVLEQQHSGAAGVRAEDDVELGWRAVGAHARTAGSGLDDPDSVDRRRQSPPLGSKLLDVSADRFLNPRGHTTPGRSGR